MNGARQRALLVFTTSALAPLAWATPGCTTIPELHFGGADGGAATADAAPDGASATPPGAVPPGPTGTVPAADAAPSASAPSPSPYCSSSASPPPLGASACCGTTACYGSACASKCALCEQSHCDPTDEVCCARGNQATCVSRPQGGAAPGCP